MSRLRRRGIPALRQWVGRVPVVGGLARRAYRLVFPAGSENYWKRRYAAGGDSGAGSQGKLARFKADVVNEFVEQNRIASVIEFGCGDGAQLGLARYPRYRGYEVSPVALSRCREMFRLNPSMSFRLMRDYAGERADLALSLDVIYHLVEDRVFERHMTRLFDSAARYVIVYSSDSDEQRENQQPHMRHRRFSAWVERNRAEWTLERHIPNPHPHRGEDREGSLADFFIYRKAG